MEHFFKRGYHSVSVEKLSIEDISMVICVRAHQHNPWIVDRIDFISSYYDPFPEIHVIDFGSAKEFADAIRDVCVRKRMHYHFIDDSGVYSAARARNYGFSVTSSDFIVFCDVDCVFYPSFFKDIIPVMSSLNMKYIIDQMLVFDVYHLGPERTEFFLLSCQDSYVETLNELSYVMATGRLSDGEFIAPYSNIFIINRKFFDIVGGYNEDFRGYGSEDFEFLVRAFTYQCNMNYPEDICLDTGSPLRNSFYECASDYRGFRSYIESSNYTAKFFSLRSFHLFHPRVSDSWYEKKDKDRKKFNTSLHRYINSPPNLLSEDYLYREKNMLCLSKDGDGWRFFLPFRLLGYYLIPCFFGENIDIDNVKLYISDKKIWSIAVLINNSQDDFYFSDLSLWIREKGGEIIFIGQGLLPNTLYYGENIGHYLSLDEVYDFSFKEFSEDDLRSGKFYIDNLISHVDSYKYPSYFHDLCKQNKNFKVKILINISGCPLSSRQTMISSMHDIASTYNDALFIVLMEDCLGFDRGLNNIVFFNSVADKYYLLSICNAVICYSIDFWLASTLYGLTSTLVGEERGQLSLVEAIHMNVQKKCPPLNEERRLNIAAWLIGNIYSQTSFCDNFTEDGAIDITYFVCKKTKIALGRMRDWSAIGPRSYLARFLPIEKSANPNLRIQSRILFKIYAIFYSFFLNKSKKESLWREPEDFLLNARHPMSRLGRALFIERR